MNFRGFFLTIICGISIQSSVAQLAWNESFPLYSVPDGQDGDAGTSQPFASLHFQQVISGSTVSAPFVWVSNMYFRLDATNGFTAGVTVTNLQVTFSTTLKNPDSLSPVFAENTGSDAKIVFARALHGIGGTYRSGSPQGWGDLILRFDSAFPFQRSNGNLLIDIQMSGVSGTIPYLDAFNDDDNSVSMLYGNGSSGTASTLALATRLEGMQIVPEPRVGALIITLIGAFALMRFRKRLR